jgi:hypothetical protein
VLVLVLVVAEEEEEEEEEEKNKKSHSFRNKQHIALHMKQKISCSYVTSIV